MSNFSWHDTQYNLADSYKVVHTIELYDLHSSISTSHTLQSMQHGMYLDSTFTGGDIASYRQCTLRNVLLCSKT